MSAVNPVKRLARKLRRHTPPPTERSIIEGFHRLYWGKHGARTWRDTWWFGVQVYKTPLDLWIYQEIICETRPDLIIETGTASGGSALFLAMACESLGAGEVVTVDISPGSGRPEHHRLRYLLGSSVEPRVLAEIAEMIRDRDRVMVVLDSDHSRDHVLAELEAYSPFVTDDCYLIVEDTNVNGHPVHRESGPGPLEAVEEFLKHHSGFEQDREREKFLLTFNPGGYLRRAASGRGEPVDGTP